ncbi:hypothetical protein CNR22_12535 [Sphingobacteriaceae bacterium]|nr:hypothetical protein CNR22_12535 [Sphingobacteriaceae bacterium]
MPETLLIYYPSNNRSNATETLACEFASRGHKVFLLTHDKKGDLHQLLEKNNVEVHSYNIEKKRPFLYYLKHVRYLIRFCNSHNITAVQSHLQQANIIAVVAQYFMKSKVVAYRHHLIEQNKMSNFFDRVINFLAKKIVVPSSVIYNHMVFEEKVKPEKVKLVPYVYDFTKFATTTIQSNEIKTKFPSKLLVLLCGRFVNLKRNDLAIKAVGALVKQGKDVKLLALDAGPELDFCKQIVADEKLEKNVFFIGYTTNVMNYVSACDILIHPSYTEASSNTVKEAAIFSKKVIVCEGVGDFSDYIVNTENGYMVNRENPLPGMITCLEEIYDGKSSPLMGDKLKETVFNRFNKSPETINKHLNLLLQ